MLIVAVLICLAVLILGGAADLFQAQYNPDELSNMGVQKR